MPLVLPLPPGENPYDLMGLGGWDEIENQIELNQRHSLLNHLTYNVSVVHELDGLYDELITIPDLAVERVAAILWVLITSGFFHRIRIEASENNQYYHLRLVEATMVYQGQLS